MGNKRSIRHDLDFSPNLTFTDYKSCRKFFLDDDVYSVGERRDFFFRISPSGSTFARTSVPSTFPPSAFATIGTGSLRVFISHGEHASRLLPSGERVGWKHCPEK